MRCTSSGSSHSSSRAASRWESPWHKAALSIKLAPDGRERGILAGANVVMPNLSPSHQRTKYSLYDNKASAGAEAAEGLQKLEEQLKGIGYEVSKERGDYENGELTVDN